MIFETFMWFHVIVQDPREVAASEHNLNYIGMSGNIGCLGST